MVTLRKRIIGVVSALVVIAALIIIGIIVSRSPKGEETPIIDGPVNENNVPQVLIQREDPPPVDVPAPTFSDEAPAERYVQQRAEIFVERFATFSNQNSNAHIDAVREMVTPRMLTWVETQGSEDQEAYQGVTTQVISTSLTSLDGNSAEVAVGVQQRLESATGQETAQRDGRVLLVQDENEWFISGFFWNE